MILWDWAINSWYITRLCFTKTGSTRNEKKSITNENRLQNNVLFKNVATYIQQSTFSRNVWEPIFHSSFIPWLSAHAIIVGLASFNCHRVLAVFFNLRDVKFGMRITTITKDIARETKSLPPTPFHGSPKRKCGFFPQHHGHTVNHPFDQFNFVCLA